jgi:hypothetical protein
MIDASIQIASVSSDDARKECFLRVQLLSGRNLGRSRRGPASDHDVEPGETVDLGDIPNEKRAN